MSGTPCSSFGLFSLPSSVSAVFSGALWRGGDPFLQHGLLGAVPHSRRLMGVWTQAGRDGLVGLERGAWVTSGQRM